MPRPQRPQRGGGVGEGLELERAEHRAPGGGVVEPRQRERVHHRRRAAVAQVVEALAVGAVHVVLQVVGDLGRERGPRALLVHVEAALREQGAQPRCRGLQLDQRSERVQEDHHL